MKAFGGASLVEIQNGIKALLDDRRYFAGLERYLVQRTAIDHGDYLSHQPEFLGHLLTSLVAGVPGGPPVTGALTGVYAGDTISFVVNWGPSFHSTTAWSGLILSVNAQKLYLHTLRNVVEAPAVPGKWWECILAGSDRFCTLKP